MRITRLQRALVTATSLILITVLVASAAGSGPPAADLYFPNGDGTNNGKGLLVSSSCFPAPCIQLTMAYMKWDFTARPLIPESATVNFARLTVDTSTNVTGTGGNVTFELRKGSSDSWTETSTVVPGYDATASGLLDTKTVSMTDGQAGQTVVFESANLATFIEGERTKNGGDNLVTLVVLITVFSGFTPAVEFKDREAGSPQLLLTASDSNAVTLRTFRAADPAVNWPLIAGGLLLAALLGGAGVYRWRLSRVRAR